MLEQVCEVHDSQDIWGWMEATGQLAWAMLQLERTVFGSVSGVDG